MFRKDAQRKRKVIKKYLKLARTLAPIAVEIRVKRKANFSRKKRTTPDASGEVPFFV